MFSNCSRLSFSKLKVLSGLLDCNVLALKCFVGSRHFSVKILNQRKSLICGLDKNLICPGNYSCRFNTSESSESPFDSVNISAIAGEDEELAKKLKVIILEAEVMRQEGLRVPSSISEMKWMELLKAPSRSKRLKLMAFWWLNEKKKLNQKKKKEDAHLKKENELKGGDKEVTGPYFYGFGGSTIFLRIYDKYIDNFHNTKLINAMKFGQNLVIDCSYEEHMNEIESSLCSSQLKVLFSDNRVQDEPFNIHFCNVNENGLVFKKLNKLIPTLYEPAFPINITEKSYLELFPKDQLVYLTPHCREELREFSSDDIYIIGAMVDKTNNDPLSLGKAKSQGLRMAKLPLERYLDWGVGCKSLTLNQMLMILHELKKSGDWIKALEHVPKRKIKGENFEKKYSSGSRRKAINLRRIFSQ